MSDWIPTLQAIADEVAGPNAHDVDRKARFPEEAIAALKRAGVLGAAVPKALGGQGLSVSELVQMCTILGRRCASTAMVVAMHHIQVGSLVAHARGSREVLEYLSAVAAEGRLIASGTSEVGPSGDMRQSVCFVEPNVDGFVVRKDCTTVSYGRMADDVLFQARRSQDAGPGDQVAVLATKGTYTLEGGGTWDTLGMRGTCSPGGTLTVRGAKWQVLDAPFAEIAAHTMVPWSHLLWSGCWLGIATDAYARSSAVVRAKGRKASGQTTPEAYGLSELAGRLQLARALVAGLVDEYEGILARNARDELESLGFSIRDNGLKLEMSRLVVEICTKALELSGIAAYKNDSEYSLGRHVRDALSTSLMISNYRIHQTNAAMLLVHKGA